MKALLALALLEMTAGSQEAKVPESVKKAEAKLIENPDDPDATLTLGKYLAFEKGEWEKAIPLLAKGSDATLKTLAEHEGQPHEKGPEMVGMGDEWLKAAKKFPKDRKSCEGRAMWWFGRAWPDLDPVWRDKLRERLHKLANLPAAYDKPNKGGGPVKGWSIPDELWESYIMTGFSHTGKTCAQILPAGKKNEVGYTGFHSLTMPTSEGKSYHVSFWAFTERTDADGTLSVRFLDAAGKLVSQSGPFIPPDSPWWKKIEGDFKCPAGAVRIDLNFTMMAKAGVTFIDDVVVECDGKNLIQNGGFEDR